MLYLYVFEKITEQLATSLQPSTRLLADVLQAERAHRRLLHQNSASPLKDVPVAELLGSGSAVKNVAGMFASAIDLFDMRLELALSENPKDKHCVISDVVDLKNIDISDVIVAGMSAASKLHLDEVRRSGLIKYIRVMEGTGKIKFMRSLVPKDPERIPSQKPNYDPQRPDYMLWARRALHDQRKRCPALHVRQLIPQAIQMVPEIILAFDDKLYRGSVWRRLLQF